MSTREQRTADWSWIERRAEGIAAMGRVERDADGFTVYSTSNPPEAQRVWDDPHAGRRCTCDLFGWAFRAGKDVACEHIRAIELANTRSEDAEMPPRVYGRLEVVR